MGKGSDLLCIPTRVALNPIDGALFVFVPGDGHSKGMGRRIQNTLRFVFVKVIEQVQWCLIVLGGVA